MCITDHCQVYGPLRYADTDAAVDAVRGVFIGLEGQVVPAFYFGHCTGHTLNSEDAGWSYRSYLRLVECPAQYPDLYGHGVGMCQQGARVMAERGAAFDQILRHYYTGIELLGWRQEERQMDIAVIAHALNVVWGHAQDLEDARAVLPGLGQKAKEPKDAVGAIKQELGLP